MKRMHGAYGTGSSSVLTFWPSLQGLQKCKINNTSNQPSFRLILGLVAQWRLGSISVVAVLSGAVCAWENVSMGKDMGGVPRKGQVKKGKRHTRQNDTTTYKS